MSGRPVQIRGLQPSYSSFLSSQYQSLMALWNEKDFINFWSGIKGFVTFLPREVKNNVDEDIQLVEAELGKLQKEVNEKTTSQLSRSIVTRRVLTVYLSIVSRIVLNKIMNLLDQKGYLERGWRPLQKGDFKEFKENEGKMA